MIGIRPGVIISRIAVFSLMLVVLASSLAIVGCGESSPEGGVKRYLNAMQNMNWDDYKAAHKPGQKFTAEQEDLARQEFKQVKVEFSDLKFKTTYDKKDKNKAVVAVTSGKISLTADVMGEKKTDTKEVKDMAEADRPVFNMIKVKEVWYIDKPIV